MRGETPTEEDKIMLSVAGKCMWRADFNCTRSEE